MNALPVSQNVANRQHPCLLMNALTVLHYPLPRTKLASLVKGRWIDGKTQTVALLRFACDTSAFFIRHTFLPSRRRDCHTTIPSPRTNPPKTALSPCFAPIPLSLNERFAGFTKCSESPTPLPPLSKGGGLTARHKLLLCFFLLAICPPFLYCKLFCRQDGGIASPSSLRSAPTIPKTALSDKKNYR